MTPTAPENASSTYRQAVKNHRLVGALTVALLSGCSGTSAHHGTTSAAAKATTDPLLHTIRSLRQGDRVDPKTLDNVTVNATRAAGTVEMNSAVYDDLTGKNSSLRVAVDCSARQSYSEWGGQPVHVERNGAQWSEPHHKGEPSAVRETCDTGSSFSSSLVVVSASASQLTIAPADDKTAHTMSRPFTRIDRSTGRILKQWIQSGSRSGTPRTDNTTTFTYGKPVTLPPIPASWIRKQA